MREKRDRQAEEVARIRVLSPHVDHIQSRKGRT
jgi:hypothetical protein